jgi:hypothetical protein
MKIACATTATAAEGKQRSGAPRQVAGLMQSTKGPAASDTNLCNTDRRHGERKSLAPVDEEEFCMGFDVSGIGALKEALATTNRNLELVLAELQETNRTRLESVSTELRQVNATLEAVLATQTTKSDVPV